MLIELQTMIGAPQERAFDLARSVDMHLASASASRERVIGGKTTGLLDLGDSATWEATHFGLRHRLTAKITEFDRPHSFVDIMTRGPFARLEHRHLFLEQPESTTLMQDHFDFASPFGIIGYSVDLVILRNHLRRFLILRNTVIKRTAEADDWKKYL